MLTYIKNVNLCIILFKIKNHKFREQTFKINERMNEENDVGKEWTARTQKLRSKREKFREQTA